MKAVVKTGALLALALLLSACANNKVHPLVCMAAGALAAGGGAYAASDENEGATALAAAAGAAAGAILCKEEEMPKPAPVEPAPAPAPAPAPTPVAPPPPPAPEAGTKISSLEGAHFDFDKATLRPEGTTKLDEAVQVMNEHSGIIVNVEGHTDNAGSDAYNQGLSERRAQTVVDYLVSKGIDASRLRPMGYGESRPAESNDTDEGRARNRRVDLIVAE